MANRRIVAMDTESVGIGPEKRSAVAQVCLIDMKTGKIYNAYIRRYNVTDYRTKYSGLTRNILRAKGRDFKTVKKEVMDFIRGSILVGHSIHYDLQGLGISYNRNDIRDTSTYWVFKMANNGKTPRLAFLAQRFLKSPIRKNGTHNCIEDTKTTLQLYRLYQQKWEEDIRNWQRRRINSSGFDEYSESGSEYSYDEYSDSEEYDDYGPFSLNNDYF